MKRKIDELGRLVIPKEMRKELGIKDNDQLNIELQDNKIIITKPDTVDYKEMVEKARKYLDNHKMGLYSNECKELSEILNENKD